jgi:hypothetical protein
MYIKILVKTDKKSSDVLSTLPKATFQVPKFKLKNSYHSRAKPWLLEELNHGVLSIR